MTYEIKQYHGTYNISVRTASVKYIVVHYVGAGSNAPGNALANCKYFAGGNRNASAHYFIDDADIYEYADPSQYYCWHVGDGKGKYGIYNSNSIGIEVCNNGGPFTDIEIDQLHWLVWKLMTDFNVNAVNVVRHYDASRKNCPAYYAQNYDKWHELWCVITSEYEEDDMFTDNDRNLLTETYSQVTKVTDPSGRNVAMNDHDHLKWIASKQAKMDEKLDQILEILGTNGTSEAE